MQRKSHRDDELPNNEPEAEERKGCQDDVQHHAGLLSGQAVRNSFFGSSARIVRSKLVHGDDAQDFLQRRLPCQSAAQAGMPQVLHALLDGNLLQ